MQYLGMKDEDGVDLFEGDIIEKWGKVELVKDIYDFGYESLECLIFNKEFNLAVRNSPSTIFDLGGDVSTSAKRIKKDNFYLFKPLKKVIFTQ